MNAEAIIALGSLAVAVMALLLKGRGETKAAAADSARTQAKLDSIAGGVDEIRIEQRAMRDRVDGLAERVAGVEASVKSAHHRLDELDAKFLAAHPPGDGWGMG